MTLDELISKLQEAKEHFVPGRSEVIISDNGAETISEVKYDSNHVYLNTKCLYE